MCDVRRETCYRNWSRTEVSFFLGGVSAPTVVVVAGWLAANSRANMDGVATDLVTAFIRVDLGLKVLIKLTSESEYGWGCHGSR